MRGLLLFWYPTGIYSVRFFFCLLISPLCSHASNKDNPSSVMVSCLVKREAQQKTFTHTWQVLLAIILRNPPTVCPTKPLNSRDRNGSVYSVYHTQQIVPCCCLQPSQTGSIMKAFTSFTTLSYRPPHYYSYALTQHVCMLCIYVRMIRRPHPSAFEHGLTNACVQFLSIFSINKQGRLSLFSRPRGVPR